jgi:predicted nucleic acid-binding protein
MSGPVFVDTNVLLYAADASERVKQPLARTWLEELWLRHAGRVSAQVLHEFYVTVTRKLSPGLERAQARELVRRYLTWGVAGGDTSLLDAAWRVEDRFGLAFWDALILASALAQRCTHLLSEDFAEGADYEGVRVVSPFTSAPGAHFQR